MKINLKPYINVTHRVQYIDISNPEIFGIEEWRDNEDWDEYLNRKKISLTLFNFNCTLYSQFKEYKV